MAQLGNIKKLEPRQIWRNEAAEFTPWLADNLTLLGESLQMDLEIQRIEAPVGPFSVDILARDLNTRRSVVIENQLEQTDHDHLGKLLTYASGYDAGCIVWIAPSIREEHRQAVDWLNQHTDADTRFFAVVMELLQIDNSLPAPNFRIVAAPNEWKKTTVRASGDSSPRAEAYRVFFQGLIDELRDKHGYTNARVGQPQSWYSFASGVSGVSYSASFAHGSRCRAEMYVDRGDKDENKKLFDRLASDRVSIESGFGNKLEWERLDDRRACRVAVYREGRIDEDAAKLSELKTWLVTQLLKFKEVFGERLRNISE